MRHVVSGVDISSRVGINNLLLPDVQEGLEGKKWWDSAASAALGPIGGIGANIAKGAQEISEGHKFKQHIRKRRKTDRLYMII